MSEELRPCPVHGMGSVIYATSSKKYVGCEACGDGKNEISFLPVEQWNSAWCWKEIGRLKAEIDRLKSLLKHGLERMKLINGENEDCNNNPLSCANHSWIFKVEEALAPAKGEEHE